jgi:UDP-glucose 6-dehydrogenase
MSKIGFIGLGVVGGATMRLAKNQGNKDILVYDPGLKKLDSMEDRDVIFISVPVPTKSNGDQDLSILEDALARCPKNSDVIIRSSVLPGTCNVQSQYFKDIGIYSSP